MENHDDRSDELTAEERKAFRSLGDERAPAGEEERILGALRSRGLVKRAAGRRPFGGAFRIAAAAALLIGTFLAGAEYGSRRREPPPIPSAAGGEEGGFAVAELGALPTFDEYRDEPDRPVRGVSLDPKGMPR
ncbi:MAG: hypothetical protein ABIK65_05255 [Candidatus Eisenbacteria bacterium]